MVTRVRSHLPLIGVVAGITLLAGVPFMVTGFYLFIATQILIYSLLAVSINVLMGYTGLTPLGHAAFFGIGAYACAYLSATRHQPFVTAFVVGIVLSVLTSLLFGAIAIRAAGIYFIMITLALNMLVYGTAYTLYGITGAENGITGVERPELLSASWVYYYFTALAFLIAMILVWRLVRSPFGLVLTGIRESESRMSTLGYNVWLHKLIAFTLSGTLAGLAGCLYAYWSQYVSVAQVDLQVSISGLLAVIIGGVGTLFGPVLGTAFLVIIQQVVSLYTERWQTILGLALILVVLFARQGVLGALQARRRRIVTGEEVETEAVSVSLAEPDSLQALRGES